MSIERPLSLPEVFTFSWFLQPTQERGYKIVHHISDGEKRKTQLHSFPCAVGEAVLEAAPNRALRLTTKWNESCLKPSPFLISIASTKLAVSRGTKNSVWIIKSSHKSKFFLSTIHFNGYVYQSKFCDFSVWFLFMQMKHIWGQSADKFRLFFVVST